MPNRLLSCVVSARALMLPGCGGGDTTPAAPATASASQATALGAAGATVNLTAADGSAFTLQLPLGALTADTTLTLLTQKPATGQRLNLPLQPAGLVLAKRVAQWVLAK